jgi:hypothetical protein
MMNRRKLVAAWVATLAIAPVIAAGRPACCIKPQVAPAAQHGCCPAPARSQASAQKGCCKAPAAPKPETRAKAGAPIAVATASVDMAAPAASLAALPPAVSIRLARRAHHAEAPDDSPPDRLSRLHVLLI